MPKIYHGNGDDVVQFKRRKDDESFLKTHHVLASLIAMFIIGTAGAFTTFATVKYVDAMQQQTKERMDRTDRVIEEQQARIERQLSTAVSEIQEIRQVLIRNPR